MQQQKAAEMFPAEIFPPNMFVQICSKYVSKKIVETFFEICSKCFQNMLTKSCRSEIFRKKRKINNIFKLYVDNGRMDPESKNETKCIGDLKKVKLLRIVPKFQNAIRRTNTKIYIIILVLVLVLLLPLPLLYPFPPRATISLQLLSQQAFEP